MFWDKKDQKMLSEDTIKQALGSPDWLSGVKINENGRVTLIIEADPADMERAETLKIEAESRTMSLDGVSDVQAVLTAQRAPGTPPPSNPSLKTHASPRRVRKGARLSDEALNQGQPQQAARIAPIPGISRILVVASAKGGVGKSTVSGHGRVSPVYTKDRPGRGLPTRSAARRSRPSSTPSRAAAAR